MIYDILYDIRLYFWALEKNCIERMTFEEKHFQNSYLTFVTIICTEHVTDTHGLTFNIETSIPTSWFEH